MVTKKKDPLSFECERFKVRGKKIKRLLNLQMSHEIFVSLLWNADAHTNTRIQTRLVFSSSMTPSSGFTARRQQHPSLPVQLGVSRHGQKHFSASSPSSPLPTGTDSLKWTEIWEQYTTVCGASVQEGIRCPNRTSARIVTSCFWTDSHKIHDSSVNNEVHLVFRKTDCVPTRVYSLVNISFFKL